MLCVYDNLIPPPACTCYTYTWAYAFTHELVGAQSSESSLSICIMMRVFLFPCMKSWGPCAWAFWRAEAWRCRKESEHWQWDRHITDTKPTNRQSDRQIDRQTDRQAERHRNLPLVWAVDEVWDFGCACDAQARMQCQTEGKLVEVSGRHVYMHVRVNVILVWGVHAWACVHVWF
jgi:hypothetical protein